MADIFISYGRTDRALVQSLAEALQSEGFSVWWDRNIGGGTEFARAIEKELDAAKTIIVAWSEASVGSHWVRDEADYAREEDKLLPLSLDGVLPPLGFRQIHALEFQGWDRTSKHPAFAKLLSSLGKQQSVAASPAPKTSRWVKPSIAILPFANLSTDKEIEFVADGITEDVIAEMSTNQHISVAARSSSFAYKNQSPNVREIGRALGVRYVAEGSVRKMGKRARISAQLVGVETGAHIWAKKFDCPLEELYENPDDLVMQVSGGLRAQLISAEQDRANKLPVEELGVWEHCQRALSVFGRGFVFPDRIRRMLQDLEQALEHAPDYSLAHAVFSFGASGALSNGAYEDHEQAGLLERSKRHLRIARTGSEEDLYCLTWIAAAEIFTGRHERAWQRLEQVLARNPANPAAQFWITQAYGWSGKHALARQALERAMAIAPEGGFARLHPWYAALTAFAAGDYEEALPPAKAQLVISPTYGACLAIAAISAFMVGDEAAARAHIVKAKTENAHLRPEKLAAMFTSQHDREKGMREYQVLEQLWAETS